jgi:hypothetical protein
MLRLVYTPTERIVLKLILKAYIQLSDMISNVRYLLKIRGFFSNKDGMDDVESIFYALNAER